MIVSYVTVLGMCAHYLLTFCLENPSPGTRYQPHTLVEATETLAREGWIYPTIEEHFQLCPDNASFVAQPDAA